jgi:sugar phosphate isomerase/epimerase
VRIGGMKRDIELSCTLYSFSFEYATGKYSLEECLRRAKKMGYSGIELVASQMVPEYPYPSEAWLREFSGLLKSNGLKPICYSAYIDMGTRSDRDLNEAEIVESTLVDMEIAKKLGFELVRTQHAISPAIYKKMLPYCKKIGMKLAIEMHHPHNPDVPVWKEYLKIMDEGEGYLGVVPDFSIFAETPHRHHIKQAIEDFGCRDDKVKEIVRRHRDGASEKELLAGQYSVGEKRFIEEVYEQYAPANMKWLDEVVKRALYVHGKFWSIEADGTDPCVPYDRLLPYLQKLGYKGYLASEYEGHHFAPDEEAAVQLDRFVRMCNRILGYA